MKKIVIDTNFLLIPFKFRVDIFSEFDRICSFNYRLYVFEQSLNELKNIVEKQRGMDKRAAQFALKLIGLKNIQVIKTEQKNVDELIIENLAKDTVIATLDINLKKQVLEKGASAIILRKKKYLQIIERKLYK
ncbi:DUF188 domain-containing protein [Candidatus Woesearchaeota archaeon]|nr:DUF188 domain-containing protein [Candidatus Woesearchaeota archaeon]